jgi:hypothetical protein
VTIIKKTELGRMWTEMVFASFEVLTRHSSGRTEESMKTLNQDIRCPGRDLNQEPPEYKSELFQLEAP